MATLAKGLAVLGAFDKDRPAMSCRRRREATGCRAPRRAAFCARSPNSVMSSRPAGSSRCRPAFSSSASPISPRRTGSSKAAPLMRQLSEQFQESCSAAILAGYRDRLCRAHSRPAASCRYRWRSGRGCRRSTPRWAARSLAFSMTPNCGGGFARCASIALYAFDHHRCSGAVRSGSRRPRAGFLDHRRRTRARPALDRGADRGP